MSPVGKALLASVLTLPLLAFVAGVLAAPAPVDPDRSRPVIIGRVDDDTPRDRSPQPRRTTDNNRGDGPDDGRDDDTGDPPGTAVTPRPRQVDGDDDDGDDDDDDHTDDRGGSRDD